MSLVAKIMGSGSQTADSKKKNRAAASNALTDGAIDTLSNVITVLGKESFPLENDIDETVFPEMCAEFAAHVENGSGVPSFDIEASPDGSREWGSVRRFFSDRRRAEKQFVTERLTNYRGVVEDLVSGLRKIGDRDQSTEKHVKDSLNDLGSAVDTGVLPEIKAALSQAVTEVTKTFAEQKQQYEKELNELNDRMSSLRQDLVAAREEMRRDALTDAYNRGAFDKAIAQSINMHFILNQPITLVMIDLDNFKQVNDTYGHAAGDEVLRMVGEAMARSFIRKSDLVARYGGDEFAVILNDTSADNCASLIDRFLERAAEIKVPYSSDDVTISCSAGYTEIHESDSIETLITRADRALYQAKADGRNRAVYVEYQDADD